jgi:hypothetical protein
MRVWTISIRRFLVSPMVLRSDFWALTAAFFDQSAVALLVKSVLIVLLIRFELTCSTLTSSLHFDLLFRTAVALAI